MNLHPPPPSLYKNGVEGVSWVLNPLHANNLPIKIYPLGCRLVVGGLGWIVDLDILDSVLTRSFYIFMVYSLGVGPKGPALVGFHGIKKTIKISSFSNSNFFFSVLKESITIKIWTCQQLIRPSLVPMKITFDLNKIKQWIVI